MDSGTMNQLLMQEAGKKFGSHKVLYSKYIPQIPASTEREYMRITNAYMKILKEELEKELPKLKEIYKQERDAQMEFGTLHVDSLRTLYDVIFKLFARIKQQVSARLQSFRLERKLRALSNLNLKLTTRQWGKAIKATLGIDIREDYYLGGFYAKQLEKWVQDNVALIKTIPDDTLDKMRDIIYDGFTKGNTTTRMVKEIQQTYGISRRRAELIARDQTAKLNGQIQRAQQMDAGIQEYIWCSTGDERVRESHAELNGHKFRWDNPPENSDGRACHPGEDYQCRCIARPVFSRDMVLPLAERS